jgi:hypothetical protein
MMQLAPSNAHQAFKQQQQQQQQQQQLTLKPRLDAMVNAQPHILQQTYLQLLGGLMSVKSDS